MSGHFQHMLSYCCLLGMASILMTSYPVVGKEYTAEVKLYVDKAGFDKWKKETGKTEIADLRADVRNVFNDINTIFKSLADDYPVDIRMQLKDIIVLQKDIYNGRDNAIHIVSLHESLDKWSRIIHKEDKFDLAILYTGYDIYNNKNNATYGYAFANTVCTQFAAGTIEMFGKLKPIGPGKPSGMAVKTAHEIGHILGANHDADVRNCRYESGYVMDAVIYLDKPHVSEFSYCSYMEFDGHFYKLKTEGNNCLESPSN